jgi:hypothetical protein
MQDRKGRMQQDQQDSVKRVVSYLQFCSTWDNLGACAVDSILATENAMAFEKKICELTWEMFSHREAHSILDTKLCKILTSSMLGLGINEFRRKPVTSPLAIDQLRRQRCIAEMTTQAVYDFTHRSFVSRLCRICAICHIFLDKHIEAPCVCSFRSSDFTCHRRSVIYMHIVHLIVLSSLCIFSLCETES